MQTRQTVSVWRVCRRADRRCSIWDAGSSGRFGLHRRTLHSPVGAEDATVTLFGAEHLTAVTAGVERYTSVGRHGFFFFKTTVRTAQDRGGYHAVYFREVIQYTFQHSSRSVNARQAALDRCRANCYSTQFDRTCSVLSGCLGSLVGRCTRKSCFPPISPCIINDIERVVF